MSLGGPGLVVLLMVVFSATPPLERGCFVRPDPLLVLATPCLRGLVRVGATALSTTPSSASLTDDKEDSDSIGSFMMFLFSNDRPLPRFVAGTFGCLALTDEPARGASPEVEAISEPI